MTAILWILGIVIVLGIVVAVRRSNEADRECCADKPSNFPVKKDVAPASISAPKKVKKTVAKKTK